MHHCSSVSCLKNIWVEKKKKKKSKKFKYLTKFGTTIVGNECKRDSRKSCRGLWACLAREEEGKKNW
jgi:hypothetical protein